MWSHLRTVLGVSAFCFGLAATTANAAETRNLNFLFACDGTNKTINFNATALGVSVNRFIQSAEVSLFENRGGLQYVILRALGDPNKQLLTLGFADNRANNLFISSLVQVATNAAGNVPFTIDGACNGGTGQIQGNVTITFFS
jgi:hypothetical protein